MSDELMLVFNGKKLVGGFGGKDNIYSEEEERIGIWIDEKLIYRKVFTFSNITVSPNMDVTVAELTGVDTFINGVWNGYYFSGSGKVYVGSGPVFLVESGALSIKNVFTTAAIAFTGSVVVDYTKTSDTI